MQNREEAAAVTSVIHLRPERLLLCVLAVVLSCAMPPAAAQQRLGTETNLPLPRFVSLNSNEVNVRVGPGSDYPIAWIFVRSGWPVEVIEEVDNWRKIRDANGDEGWVFYSLLSGERTALVAPQSDGPPLALRAEPSPSARIVAYLDPGVLARVDSCRDDWCRLTDTRFDGWIEEDRLWGVYPGETVD